MLVLVSRWNARRPDVTNKAEEFLRSQLPGPDGARCLYIRFARLHSYHVLIWIASSTCMDMFSGIVQKNPPKISTGCVFLGRTVFCNPTWAADGHLYSRWVPRWWEWPTRYVAVYLTHFYTHDMLWNGIWSLFYPGNWLISGTTFLIKQKLVDLSVNDLWLDRLHFHRFCSSLRSSSTCLLNISAFWGTVLYCFAYLTWLWPAGPSFGPPSNARGWAYARVILIVCFTHSVTHSNPHCHVMWFGARLGWLQATWSCWPGRPSWVNYTNHAHILMSVQNAHTSKLTLICIHNLNLLVIANVSGWGT